MARAGIPVVNHRFIPAEDKSLAAADACCIDTLTVFAAARRRVYSPSSRAANTLGFICGKVQLWEKLPAAPHHPHDASSNQPASV